MASVGPGSEGPQGIYVQSASGRIYARHFSSKTPAWAVYDFVPAGRMVDAAMLPKFTGSFLPDSWILGQFVNTHWYIVHTASIPSRTYILKLQDRAAHKRLGSNIYDKHTCKKIELGTESFVETDIPTLELMLCYRQAPSGENGLRPWGKEKPSADTSDLPKKLPVSVAAAASTAPQLAPVQPVTHSTGSAHDLRIVATFGQEVPRMRFTTTSGICYQPTLPADARVTAVATVFGTDILEVLREDEVLEPRLRTMSGLPQDALIVAKMAARQPGPHQRAFHIVWLPSSREFVRVAVKLSPMALGPSELMQSLDRALAFRHAGKFCLSSSTYTKSHTVVWGGYQRLLQTRTPFWVWNESARAERKAIPDSEVTTYVEAPTNNVEELHVDDSTSPQQSGYYARGAPDDAAARLAVDQYEMRSQVNAAASTREALVQLLREERQVEQARLNASVPAQLTRELISSAFAAARMPPVGLVYSRWIPERCSQMSLHTTSELGARRECNPGLQVLDGCKDEIALCLTTSTPFETRFWDVRHGAHGTEVVPVQLPSSLTVPVSPVKADVIDLTCDDDVHMGTASASSSRAHIEPVSRVLPSARLHLRPSVDGHTHYLDSIIAPSGQPRSGSVLPYKPCRAGQDCYQGPAYYEIPDLVEYIASTLSENIIINEAGEIMSLAGAADMGSALASTASVSAYVVAHGWFSTEGKDNRNCPWMFCHFPGDSKRVRFIETACREKKTKTPEYVRQLAAELNNALKSGGPFGTPTRIAVVRGSITSTSIGLQTRHVAGSKRARDSTVISSAPLPAGPEKKTVTWYLHIAAVGRPVIFPGCDGATIDMSDVVAAQRAYEQALRGSMGVALEMESVSPHNCAVAPSLSMLSPTESSSHDLVSMKREPVLPDCLKVHRAHHLRGEPTFPPSNIPLQFLSADITDRMLEKHTVFIRTQPQGTQARDAQRGYPASDFLDHLTQLLLCNFRCQAATWRDIKAALFPSNSAPAPMVVSAAVSAPVAASVPTVKASSAAVAGADNIGSTEVQPPGARPPPLHQLSETHVSEFVATLQANAEGDSRALAALCSDDFRIVDVSDPSEGYAIPVTRDTLSPTGSLLALTHTDVSVTNELLFCPISVTQAANSKSWWNRMAPLLASMSPTGPPLHGVQLKDEKGPVLSMNCSGRHTSRPSVIPPTFRRGRVWVRIATIHARTPVRVHLGFKFADENAPEGVLPNELVDALERHVSAAIRSVEFLQTDTRAETSVVATSICPVAEFALEHKWSKHSLFVRCLVALILLDASMAPYLKDANANISITGGEDVVPLVLGLEACYDEASATVSIGSTPECGIHAQGMGLWMQHVADDMMSQMSQQLHDAHARVSVTDVMGDLVHNVTDGRGMDRIISIAMKPHVLLNTAEHALSMYLRDKAVEFIRESCKPLQSASASASATTAQWCPAYLLQHLAMPDDTTGVCRRYVNGNCNIRDATILIGHPRHVRHDDMEGAEDGSVASTHMPAAPQLVQVQMRQPHAKSISNAQIEGLCLDGNPTTRALLGGIGDPEACRSVMSDMEGAVSQLVQQRQDEAIPTGTPCSMVVAHSFKTCASHSGAPPTACAITAGSTLFPNQCLRTSAAYIRAALTGTIQYASTCPAPHVVPACIVAEDMRLRCSLAVKGLRSLQATTLLSNQKDWDLASYAAYASMQLLHRDIAIMLCGSSDTMHVLERSGEERCEQPGWRGMQRYYNRIGTMLPPSLYTLLHSDMSAANVSKHTDHGSEVKGSESASAQSLTSVAAAVAFVTNARKPAAIPMVISALSPAHENHPASHGAGAFLEASDVRHSGMFFPMEDRGEDTEPEAGWGDGDRAGMGQSDEGAAGEEEGGDGASVAATEYDSSQ